MGRKKRKHGYSRYSELAKRRRNLETPEERNLRLTKNRVRAAQKRASETLEERCVRLAVARERINARRNQLKNEAESANVAEILEKINLSKSKSEVKSLVAKLDKKQRNAYEAYMQLKSEREASAKRAAERRSQETPEERAHRLEQGRIRVAMIRAKESEEKRADRLARLQTQIKKHRDLKKLQNVQLGESCINVDTYTNYLIALNQNLENINKRTKCFSKNLLGIPHIQEQECVRTDNVGLLYQNYNAYQSYQLMCAQQQYKAKIFESLNYVPYMANDVLDSTTIDVAPVECEVLIEEGNDHEDIIPLNKEDNPDNPVSSGEREVDEPFSELVTHNQPCQDGSFPSVDLRFLQFLVSCQQYQHHQ